METEGKKTIAGSDSFKSSLFEAISGGKAGRNILDFSDLEHFALKLLYEEQEGEKVYSVIANELAGELSEILVDEYQDSNMVSGIYCKSAFQRAFFYGKCLSGRRCEAKPSTVSDWQDRSFSL